MKSKTINKKEEKARVFIISCVFGLIDVLESPVCGGVEV
jgi:hypothetical protein